METIYVWEIKKLKSDLAAGRLSGKQTIVYLTFILGVQTGLRVLAYFIAEASNLWDDISTAVFFLMLAGGVAYCFHANGGRKGKDFISRYVALAWVFGVRFVIMVEFPLTFCFYVAPSLFFEIPDQTQWYDVVFNSGLSLVFYSFLAGHIRDVALNKVPADVDELDYTDKYPEDFDPAVYPSSLRRYVSTLIDGALIFTVCVVTIHLLQGVASVFTFWLWFLVLFSYEPILTSRFCTLGQKITGIRVRSLASRERISLIDAYIRSAMKLLLGFVSFFLMPATRKRRAIHDFVAGSVAVYAENIITEE
jgi:uncharacterized RDD family membrane protein YckC